MNGINCWLLLGQVLEYRSGGGGVILAWVAGMGLVAVASTLLFAFFSL